MLAFLRHIASACAEVGLSGAVPFGSLVYDIAARAIEKYRETQRQGQIAADLEAVVQADLAQIRTEAAAIAREVVGNSPAGVQLESYLTQIPSVARQSLRRPQDPAGKSVPAQMRLAEPASLAAILPQRPPRFRAGQAVPHAPQWILQELLGAGGFGEVWLARHNFLDDSRAFKFCLDPQARDRLLRHEGEVVRQVMKAGVSLRPEEPGIVRLLDTYLDGETPWLAYEYVQGGDLAGLVRQLSARPLVKRADVALQLLRSLAKIVGRLHRLPQPIIHRDLKPANVLVRQVEGRIVLRVTDFGIGAAASDLALRHASVSTPSMALGDTLRGSHTPLYASPQQKKGQKPDVRDDVYALGIIGYQLLLCDTTAERPGGKWRKRLADAELSDEVLNLLESCWDDDPTERPSDALVLADGLKARPKVPIPEPVQVLVPTWDDVLADFREGVKANDQTEWLDANIAKLPRWQAAATANIAEAMVLLGFCCDEGKGVPKDEALAVSWYRKAADLGNTAGMINLGLSYDAGIGVPKDEVEAVRWYRRAAELGNAEGMINLGLSYDAGTGVEEDEAEAVRWYRHAADLGNADAMRKLGLMYSNGCGVEKDDAKALDLFRCAADLGDAPAMFILGIRHQQGAGVTKDEAEAVNWFRKAAELGNTPAMVALGAAYHNGRGVTEDKQEAVRWFHKAAELGNADAMCYLGLSYNNGEGVEEDKLEAVRWYRKAADLGDADSMYLLGLKYRDGDGVAKNSAEAVRWFQKAAELEDAESMHTLGVMYARGSGIPKDEETATSWYRKAAELGHGPSIAALKRRGG